MKLAHLSAVALLASASLLGMAGNASARQNDPSCTVATLKGSFGYTVTGVLTAGPTPGPFAAVGRLTFDGAGNFQNIRTISRNGVITPNATGIGTYSLASDCTGTLTFSDGGVVTLSTYIVVDGDGDEFRMIATSPGTVLTVAGRRQFDSSKQK